MGNDKPSPDSEDANDEFASLDPNGSDTLRDRLKGETYEHAMPPRFEDEGQLGG